MYATVEELETQGTQIHRLEALLGHFIISTETSLNQLSREMREFKNEMREFKNESVAFRDRMEVTILELKQSQQEMKVTQEELKITTQELRDDSRESEKRWGELANKMGTFAEDIAFPNILRIGREMTGEEEALFTGVRIWKRSPVNKDKRREFDVIAEFTDYVFWNETKSTASIHEIDKFVQLINGGTFLEYFPHLSNKKLIPVFACMYMDVSLVNYASKHNLPVIGMGERTMDFLNLPVLQGYFSTPE